MDGMRAMRIIYVRRSFVDARNGILPNENEVNEMMQSLIEEEGFHRILDSMDKGTVSYSEKAAN